VNSVRTVSDTKRAFYNFHTRPVNSIYRRVVEELMVEMHLLAVNVDFRYDPIYALGVVTTFDRFMQGYRPEQDKESIFNALCQALEDNSQRYRDDSQKLLSLASRFSWDALLIPEKSAAIPDVSHLREWTQAISAKRNSEGTATQEKFKYSRLFAIGLYTILDTANPDITKDESKRNEPFKEICNALNLSEDKVQKDLELYRSNLEKMSQAQAVIAEALAADRKKREERAQAKSAPETASSETPIDQPSSGS
jgi:photosystem II biogenesis protein Psp29